MHGIHVLPDKVFSFFTLTGSSDVKRYSQHIGQLDSMPCSRQMWVSFKLRFMQVLHFMQWKLSIPKPLPCRHTLQNCQKAGVRVRIQVL